MILMVSLLILNIALFLFIIGGFWGALWIPTKKSDYERIAECIDLRPGMSFYDLGSGTGDLLFYLSKTYGIKCVGIEISPILYFYSKFKSLFSKDVEIRYGDFFRHDLSKADILYTFLHPKMYDRLRNKIDSNIGRHSTLILLSTWPFKNANPLKVSKKNKKATYYLYKKADL